MQQQGIALTGRGQDLNAALAELYPFATNVDSVLAVLNRDSAATSTLLDDGGQVLAAVTRSPAALQQLVNNANTTFSATAAQAAALAATIKAFPPFLSATKTTIDRVARFAVTTKPLVDELRPAAVQLSPALESLAVLAPELNSLLVNIGPLTSASKAGVPAVDAVPERQRPAAHPPDAVPRRGHPRGRLHQHLPARGRGVLRQRDRGLTGHVARGFRQRRPSLRPRIEPAQSGDAHGLFDTVWRATAATRIWSRAVTRAWCRDFRCSEVICARATLSRRLALLSRPLSPRS